MLNSVKEANLQFVMASSSDLLPAASDLPEYFGVTEEEFNRNLKKWRRPTADFETLVVSETCDPGTFCKNSLVVPIVTSSVFVLHGPATETVTTVSLAVLLVFFMKIVLILSNDNTKNLHGYS